MLATAQRFSIGMHAKCISMHGHWAARAPDVHCKALGVMGNGSVLAGGLDTGVWRPRHGHLEV